MASDSEHLSILIERQAVAVYEYAADPVNLPQWGSGLASTSVELVDGQLGG